MSERANTNGLHAFDYPRGYSPKASEELKKSIEEGYAQAEKRKIRENNRKLLLVSIGLIIAVGIISYFIFS